jgi:hypothetical protein
MTVETTSTDEEDAEQPQKEQGNERPAPIFPHQRKGLEQFERPTSELLPLAQLAGEKQQKTSARSMTRWGRKLGAAESGTDDRREDEERLVTDGTAWTRTQTGDEENEGGRR